MDNELRPDNPRDKVKKMSSASHDVLRWGARLGLIGTTDFINLENGRKFT